MPILSRRHFSASLGASLLLAPYLRLLEKPARAATTGKAKRLLLFCTMGTNPDLWKPSGGDSSVTFSSMNQPLSTVKQNVVLIDGLVSGNPGDNHGAPDGITGLGFNGGNATISVDQFVADKLKAAGTVTPLPSLILGANATVGGGRTFFWRGGNNLTPISSPLSAFTTAFGAGVPAATGSTGSTTSAVSAQLKRRKSILDLIKGEITTLEGRVGAAEKAKLELHLTSLKQVEDRLSQAMSSSTSTGTTTTPKPSAACSKPATPSDSTTNILTANQLHMDIIVSAFACDITRVAAIEFGSDQSMPVDLPDLGLQGDEHGGFIHSGSVDNFKSLVKFEQWLAGRFVDIITKLKAIPEADGSGSLFDNTIIAWCRDMGDAVNHNQKNMNFVLAGGAGGYLKTSAGGRYIHTDGSDPGARHERVLLSLIDAMGITSFNGFGDATLAGKTPLSGIAA